MTKPVIKSELFNTICDALDKHQGREVSSAPIRAKEAGPALQVLLVEDGVVNQRVARGFLERSGHKVTVAGNGREGIEALAQGAFDLVLMDVQMPVMDGLEATAVIREREQESGGHVPIIAMTAAAMKGDRERCLAGGMDAYVSKPIDPEELFSTMKNLLTVKQRGSNSSAKSGNTSPGNSKPPTQIIDLEYAIRLIPGGIDGARSLAEIFLDECQRLTLEIRQGVAELDAKVLRRAAHTLKSSAQIFAAHQLAGIARELEQLGRTENVKEAESCLSELEQAANDACQAVRDWLKK
jgi:CheY-like chemotaxis protein